jgi:spore coat protein H
MATLGFGTESLRDSESGCAELWVMTRHSCRLRVALLRGWKFVPVRPEFYLFAIAAPRPLRDRSCRRMHAAQRWTIGSRAIHRSCLLVALLAGSVDLGAADKGGENKTERRARLSAGFFDEPVVRVFDFSIPEPALAQLRRSPRTYTPCTVREGGLVLSNVAVRIKGMGSYRSIDEKPSLAVKFDEFATNQSYVGLDKLMFNNSVQDSTYVAEYLGTSLFRDAGLPAARVTHARVRLNGRDLGLYVVIEAMNKDFLKRNFGSGKGNLYEAYLGDVGSGRMEQDNGADTSQADLQALHRACVIADPADRWRALDKVLDVDRFVSFVAMEMLTTHWDGYAIHTNNFRIYHDPKSEKMVFITHGLDWAFRRPSISIQPPMKSLVGRAVLSTPEGQALYRERIGTLFTNVFKVDLLTRRLDQALDKIQRSGLEANDLANIERRAALMRERIRTRATNVSNQLRGVPPEPMLFGADGYARPASWRDEPDRGNALLERVTLDGRDALHIGARNERTRASWRSQVYLNRGWYRFEGLARINLENSGSARLRISGDTRSVGMPGTGGNWTALAHDFEVQEDGIDVEFVCELNALRGDAWFDAASLRVKRIDASQARPLIRRPVQRQ